MGFAEDLEKFATKQEKSLDDMTTAVLFKLNKLVVMRTPVRLGQARGGWVASLGSPSSSGGRLDKDGDPTTGRADRVASDAFGKVYWLTNNVKHIRFLEYGTAPYGFSSQALNGMVRVSVREIQNEISRQVRAM